MLTGSFVEARNLGKVEFVSGPGENLLPNGGFEASRSGVPADWAAERTDITTPSVSSDRSAVGLRSACLRMDKATMGMRQGMYSRRIPIEASRPYVLSYFARIEGGRHPMQMGGKNGWNALTGEAVWLDAAGKSLRRDWLTRLSLRRDIWQHVSWNLTSPERAERMVVNFIIRNHTGTTWVDEVVLRTAKP